LITVKHRFTLDVPTNHITENVVRYRSTPFDTVRHRSISFDIGISFMRFVISSEVVRPCLALGGDGAAVDLHAVRLGLDEVFALNV